MTETLKKDIKSNYPYDNENEQKLHLNAVQLIAMRVGAPQQEVKRIYELVLKRFKRKAKLYDFLPILVSRRVEYLLDKRNSMKNRIKQN